MLLRCLSEEGGLRLRDMVAGGPRPHGGRSAPGAADETVQAMRPGRNTRRARRVSGVVPRGSRSRSRTPPSEPGSMRASSSTDVVGSLASNAGLPPGDPSGPALPGAVGAGTGELVGVLSAVPSGAATGQVAAVDVRDLPERDPLAVRPHDAHVIPQTPGGRARPEPREDCAVPGPALSVPGQSGTEVHLSLGAANPGSSELSGDAPPVGLPLCEQPPCEQPSEVLVGPALPALPAEVPPGELPVHGLDGSGVDQPAGAECAGCSDPPREPTPRVRPSSLVNNPPMCYLLSRVILKQTCLMCLSIGGFQSRGLHLSMPCKGRGLAERKGPLLLKKITAPTLHTYLGVSETEGYLIWGSL